MPDLESTGLVEEIKKTRKGCAIKHLSGRLSEEKYGLSSIVETTSTVLYCPVSLLRSYLDHTHPTYGTVQVQKSSDAAYIAPAS